MKEDRVTNTEVDAGKFEAAYGEPVDDDRPTRREIEAEEREQDQ